MTRKLKPNDEVPKRILSFVFVKQGFVNRVIMSVNIPSLPNSLLSHSSAFILLTERTGAKMGWSGNTTWNCDPRRELCSAAFYSVEKHAYKVCLFSSFIFFFKRHNVWLIHFDSLTDSPTNSELRLDGFSNNQDNGKLSNHMSAQPGIPVIINASPTALLASSLKTDFCNRWYVRIKSTKRSDPV